MMIHIGVFLSLNLRLHTSFEKSIIIERAIQCFKDRTENFDDYYPCKHLGCDVNHVYNWTGLFASMHNAAIRHIKFSMLVRLLEGDQA
jgi:putative transposase